jgi:uncharacterized membrane protein
MYLIRLFSSLNRYWIIAAILILTKICLHLFTNTNYELHRDELLYFNMADHLDFGYVTVPPLTGFIAFISKSIFGYSVAGFRFFPMLAGTFSLLLITILVREMGGGITALLIAGISFVFSPGFLLFNTAFTPNVTEQLIWLLITFLLYRMVRNNNPKLWIIIGLLAGAGFLNKYSILIFAAGILLSLMLSTHKEIISNRWFFLAIGISALMAIPNIAWQYAHNWPVIRHMSELKATQLNNLSTIDFFRELFGLMQGATIVWLAGLLALLFEKNERKIRFLGTGSLIIILIFIVLDGKAYYVMGILPFLLAAGGCAIEKMEIGKLKILRNFAYSAGLISLLISLPYGIPLLSFDKLEKYAGVTSQLSVYPFEKWEDGKNHLITQAYSDMTGWNELASKVYDAYSLLSSEEKSSCLIYCQKNYGVAGAINFYGIKYGLPEAVTFHESYTLWAPDTIMSGPLIFVYRDSDNMNELFREVIETGSVSDVYFRENGISVFLCKYPKKDICKIYGETASEEKRAFRRQ